MKEIIYEFLDYISLEKKYSDNTEINYEIDLYKYEEYLTRNKLNYLKIKYQDISEYMMFLKKSNYKPASINRNLSAVRSFYKYLSSKKVIDSNPLDLVKGIKGEKRLPNYFKYDEFTAMLEILKDNKPLNIRNRLIIELLLATGLRVSELVSIKVQDIDLNSREIKVLGKGKKERIVFFGVHSYDALEDYLKNSRTKLLKDKANDSLLLNNNGGSLTDRGVRLIIESIIKNASIKSKVSPHTFRHTFATMMLSGGCDIKSVQELLGHANLNTTSIYTHLTNEEIRRAFLNTHPRAKK